MSTNPSHNLQAVQETLNELIQKYEEELKALPPTAIKKQEVDRLKEELVINAKLAVLFEAVGLLMKKLQALNQPQE